MNEVLLKYVPLADVAAWLARGWAIVDDFATCHHGAHAVLMKKVAP
jgi:hypothetical protein